MTLTQRKKVQFPKSQKGCTSARPQEPRESSPWLKLWDPADFLCPAPAVCLLRSGSSFQSADGTQQGSQAGQSPPDEWNEGHDKALALPFTVSFITDFGPQTTLLHCGSFVCLPKSQRITKEQLLAGKRKAILCVSLGDLQAFSMKNQGYQEVMGQDSANSVPQFLDLLDEGAQLLSQKAN
eukprot:s393_g37.t1